MMVAGAGMRTPRQHRRTDLGLRQVILPSTGPSVIAGLLYVAMPLRLATRS